MGNKRLLIQGGKSRGDNYAYGIWVNFSKSFNSSSFTITTTPYREPLTDWKQAFNVAIADVSTSGFSWGRDGKLYTEQFIYWYACGY